MNFAAIPPEIISTQLNSGPGAASMEAAASAWSALAAELRSAAATYESTIVELTDEQRTPSVTAAAESYAEWLHKTAGRAEQAAALAGEAVLAFQQAHAAVVPPIGIALNRAHLAMLRQGNLMGTNAPAIAAVEAEYGAMWVQDALAMRSYAARAVLVARLDPFTPPPCPDGPGAAPVSAAPTGTASRGVPVRQCTGVREVLAVSLGRAGSVGTLSVPVRWVRSRR